METRKDAVAEAPVASEAPSFLKALFHGEFAEEMVFPYPEIPADVKETVEAFSEAFRDFDAANIDEQRLGAMLSKVDLARAEAVLIPDTALPSLDLVDRLEAACGRPVLTANQVTIWAALGLAGQPLTVSGFGRLFNIPGKEDWR